MLIEMTGALIQVGKIQYQLHPSGCRKPASASSDDHLGCRDQIRDLVSDVAFGKPDSFLKDGHCFAWKGLQTQRGVRPASVSLQLSKTPLCIVRDRVEGKRQNSASGQCLLLQSSCLDAIDLGHLASDGSECDSRGDQRKYASHKALVPIGPELQAMGR